MSVTNENWVYILIYEPPKHLSILAGGPPQALPSASSDLTRLLNVAADELRAAPAGKRSRDDPTHIIPSQTGGYRRLPSSQSRHRHRSLIFKPAERCIAFCLGLGSGSCLPVYSPCLRASHPCSSHNLLSACGCGCRGVGRGAVFGAGGGGAVLPRHTHHTQGNHPLIRHAMCHVHPNFIKQMSGRYKS